MVEAVYYVVRRRAGMLSSMKCFGALPDWAQGKHAATRGLVYAVQLDALEDGDRWVGMTLSELDYMRELGSLPRSNLSRPPASKGGSTRLLGDWWSPPAPTWDQKAPGEPHPAPDQVKAKPDAPARQREVSE